MHLSLTLYPQPGIYTLCWFTGPLSIRVYSYMRFEYCISAQECKPNEICSKFIPIYIYFSSDYLCIVLCTQQTKLENRLKKSDFQRKELRRWTCTAPEMLNSNISANIWLNVGFFFGSTYTPPIYYIDIDKFRLMITIVQFLWYNIMYFVLLYLL